MIEVLKKLNLGILTVVCVVFNILINILYHLAKGCCGGNSQHLLDFMPHYQETIITDQNSVFSSVVSCMCVSTFANLVRIIFVLFICALSILLVYLFFKNMFLFLYKKKVQWQYILKILLYLVITFIMFCIL